MRSIAEHQAAVRAVLAPLRDREPELWRGILPPLGAQPRVLAQDVVSPIDLPPFDNSQMDGYAVRSAEVAARSGIGDGVGIEFSVAPRIPAGASVGVLEPGTAAPIMTGAPIPTGADAVVPIEECLPDHFQPEAVAATVRFAAETAARPGTFVRRRGSDLAAGSLLLAAGTLLGPAQWGVLAAAGLAAVPLLSRIRVLVLSTGDELSARGSALTPGRIYDANSSSLAIALAGAGAEVVASRVVSDDAESMRAIIREHASSPGPGAGIDLILTTGGVSQGAYEVVRDVFEGGGVEFVNVAMQPGGPQGLGITAVDGAQIPVVAFPGNPVSALVSFEMFLRPLLRELHGLSPDRPQREAALTTAIDSPPAKHQVRRGRMTASGEVEVIGGASSHLIYNYAASNVLIHVPEGVSHLEPGDRVSVWRIDG